MTAPVHNKVKAAGGAGAASIVLVWFFNQVGLDVSAEVASAMTTVIATGAGYLKAS